MKQLEAAAPLPSIREVKFWQSLPVEIPGQKEGTPAALPTAASTPGDAQQPTVPTSGSLEDTTKATTGGGGGAKATKTTPSDSSLLWAIQTMQRALPDMLDPLTHQVQEAKSQEEREADRLLKLGAIVPAVMSSVPPSRQDMTRGAKRLADSGNQDSIKHARFVA